MRPSPILESGARVALIAPAGPLRVPADLDRASANAATMGWEPVIGGHAHERADYFAGNDEHRLADLNDALRDDRIDAIWCLRGGYGAMRLLDGIDYDALKRKPKAIIGYSDITALHCAVSVRAQLGGIHGPTARAKLTAFAEKSLRAAATHADNPCGKAENGRCLVGGRASGRLLAGNLALMCALVGTPYQPDFTGTILVLEDVNEAPYRIERMLLQLRMAGVLKRCAGIAFGTFSNTGETDDASLGGSRTVGQVLEEAAKAVGIPAVGGIPVGHMDDQWSLPQGADAELDAESCTLNVNWQ